MSILPAILWHHRIIYSCYLACLSIIDAFLMVLVQCFIVVLSAIKLTCHHMTLLAKISIHVIFFVSQSLMYYVDVDPMFHCCVVQATNLPLVLWHHLQNYLYKLISSFSIIDASSEMFIQCSFNVLFIHQTYLLSCDIIGRIIITC